MKLVLFDTDSVLIKLRDVYLESFSQALNEIFGTHIALDKQYYGMTDKGVIMTVLKKNGFSDGDISKNMETIIKHFEKTYKTNFHREKLEILPGVVELLEYLIKREDIILGNYTGNIEPLGIFKLEKVDLLKYFEIKNFGDKFDSKIGIILASIEDAKKKHPGQDIEVFVLDDAPIGVDAGNKAGAITIGVATGSYSENDLRKAKFVLSDLSDTKKVLEILGVE